MTHTQNTKTRPSAAKVEDILKRRIANLKFSIVDHPSHQAALAGLEEELVRSSIRSKTGEPLPARGRIFQGLSGAGKTTALESFALKHQDVVCNYHDAKKVVIVEVPDQVTRKSLAAAIVDELGYKATLTHNANMLVNYIAKIVAKTETQLIILDEAHHIMPRGALLGQSYTKQSLRARESAAEFLKSLLNKISCPIALFGLPVLTDLYEAPQLFGRLRPDVPIIAYDWTDIAGQVHFRRLLKNFEQLLGFSKPSNLSDTSFARRFYLVTGGRPGLVSKYLSRATEVATKRNMDCITRKLMAEVFASWDQGVTAPKKIDFTEDLECDEDLTLEELSAKISKVEFDRKTNPFLCSNKMCGKLWKESYLDDNLVQPDERKLSKPKKPLKGTGKSLRIFGS